jgi:hypothetical protein
MTKNFSFGWILCLLAALSLVGTVSCQRKDNLPEDKIGVFKSVRLSLSVGSSPQTKMVADDLHFAELGDSPSFRGLEDMKMVAFKVKSPQITVQGDDHALNLPISVPAFNALNYPKVSAYFYPSGIDTFIPIGTTHVLLYGRAPGDEKESYGSLIPRGFDTQSTTATASSFGFDPDVMYPGDEVPSEATVIASVMNDIMLGNPKRINDCWYQRGTEIVKIPVEINWNETVEDVNLRKAYTDITNDGAIIPGSGPMVESMLSSLYSFFKGYESSSKTPYEFSENGEHYQVYKQNGDSLLYKDLLNALKYDVLDRFTLNTAHASSFITVNDQDLTVCFNQENYSQLSTYPESMGLPTGCAVLRWTPTGFVVPKFSGVEGMAPLNRYCYPTGLYYYVCTDIKTSQDEDIAASYGNVDYTTWKQVTDDYTLGTEITSNTTSVALVKPIQYAVGMLSATVKSDRDWLQDNDDFPETIVSATGENLPVTGIILSGQYAQNFDFTPVASAVEYYSYDKQTPGVYLTKEKSAPIRTLSLPTPEGKDIYFTLEFLNNSGKTFYGADGRVLPGRKFYMVGKMELPTDPQKRKFEQIFVQDHITTLNCTIKSLAGAYNAVPDLGIPQLVIGVQTQVNWELASPTTLLLE